MAGHKKLPVIDVWMHTPDGKSYHETAYAGYGKFGGKDYYVALSECNPDEETAQLTKKEHRARGIEIAFDEYEKNNVVMHAKFPVFTETATYDGSFDKQCKQCRKQGMSWEDDDPTREVNTWCKADLKENFIELQKEFEDLEEEIERERHESKRLRECLQKYTDDEEQLTGKKRRVQDEY